MESLKERIKLKKQNVYTYRKNSDFVTIKTKNSCYYYKIFFIISIANSIPEEFKPKENYKISEGEVMIIQAELLNKNELYFNENNEEIEFSEKYYEIYSLAELKNNGKGFEWFTKLSEFKEAFMNAIKNNKYELLLIKNVLLLSINIINIFGLNNNMSLILRPYLNNADITKTKNNELVYINNSKNNFININSSNNANDFFSNAINNNITRNKCPSISVIVNNNSNKMKKEFIDKKRLKPKKRFTKSSDIYNGSPTKITSNNENSRNNINKKNKLSIANMINDFLIDLSTKNKIYDFEVDALSKYSSVIKNEEEESIIGDMISIFKVKKYRLLYKATRDGDSASKFHSMCDNYSNLIVLIETADGVRFGGYTSSKFKGSSHMKKDNSAFLFSLDLKKVYKIKPEEYAIYCYPNSGPSFSRGSLHVPDNFFVKYGKTGTKGGPYQFEVDYELNNGKKQFIIKELEVFQVKVGEY